MGACLSLIRAGTEWMAMILQEDFYVQSLEGPLGSRIPILTNLAHWIITFIF